MKFPLECIAHGAGNHWEAICLDLDIAVQGSSLDEVTRLLRESVETYIEDAMAQNEPTRSQLLSRGVPFLVRVCWAARMFAATMRGRHLERSRREATIGFPVECHA